MDLVSRFTILEAIKQGQGCSVQQGPLLLFRSLIQTSAIRAEVQGAAG